MYVHKMLLIVTTIIAGQMLLHAETGSTFRLSPLALVCLPIYSFIQQFSPKGLHKLVLAFSQTEATMKI